MKAILFTLILFLYSVSSSFSDEKNNNFMELKKQLNLKDNQKLVLIFTSVHDCQKCVTLPLTYLECSKIEKLKNDLLTVAAVKCEREIEKFRFTKLFNWQNPVIRDDGHLKNNLNLPKETIFAIFDSDGNILLKYKNLKDFDCKQIAKIRKNK